MSEKPSPKLPYDEQDDRYLFDDDGMAVASSGECTGMMPTPAKTEAELESYSRIYNVPLAKEEQDHLKDANGQSK